MQENAFGGSLGACFGTRGLLQIICPRRLATVAPDKRSVTLTGRAGVRGTLCGDSNAQDRIGTLPSGCRIRNIAFDRTVVRMRNESIV